MRMPCPEGKVPEGRKGILDRSRWNDRASMTLRHLPCCASPPLAPSFACGLQHQHARRPPVPPEGSLAAGRLFGKPTQQIAVPDEVVRKHRGCSFRPATDDMVSPSVVSSGETTRRLHPGAGGIA